MARPRTATNILDARGAFKKNPQRKREGEPVVEDPFPKSPPKHLTDAEKKCWREVVKMAPAGVLTAADALCVEIIARLLAEYRATKRKFPAPKLLRLTSEMGKIGLTPSSRASLSVKKPKANDFDDV